MEREYVQGGAGLRMRRGVADAGVTPRICHKREVRDPRSSQDTRRTRTRTWVPRSVITRRTQTRAWAPRRVDTRRTQTQAWAPRCVDTGTRRPRYTMSRTRRFAL